MAIDLDRLLSIRFIIEPSRCSFPHDADTTTSESCPWVADRRRVVVVLEKTSGIWAPREGQDDRPSRAARKCGRDLSSILNHVAVFVPLCSDRVSSVMFRRCPWWWCSRWRCRCSSRHDGPVLARAARAAAAFGQGGAFGSLYTSASDPRRDGHGYKRVLTGVGKPRRSLCRALSVVAAALLFPNGRPSSRRRRRSQVQVTCSSPGDSNRHRSGTPASREAITHSAGGDDVTQHRRRWPGAAARSPRS